MTRVIDQMTQISDFGVLSGASHNIMYVWSYLAEQNSEALERGFVNFCRSAILNQSYYGFNKYLNFYDYPLEALSHLERNSGPYEKGRLILESELLLPLKDLARKIFEGRFCSKRAP